MARAYKALRVEMFANDITQEDIAKRIGKSKQYVSDRMTGKADFTIGACCTILKMLGRKRIQSEHKARMYQLRRDRMPITFDEYEFKKTQYRLTREIKLFGNTESEPIRKAYGLFSDAQAQKAVAR